GVGVIRSTDGGASWLAPVAVGGAGGTIGTIAVNPTSPQTVFAATSRGLYRSLDGGGTWGQVLGGGSATSVVLDPANPSTMYAGIEGPLGTPSSLWKSTAGGNPGSFTKLSGSGACTLPVFPQRSRVALAIARSSPSTLYLAYDTCDPDLFPCPTTA